MIEIDLLTIEDLSKLIKFLTNYKSSISAVQIMISNARYHLGETAHSKNLLLM